MSTRHLAIVGFLFSALCVPCRGVINGSVAQGVYVGVAGLRVTSFGDAPVCSSVLVAPRVVLTSAHCVQNLALGCATLADDPLSVTFAESSGGWSDRASFDARTVAVEDYAVRPEVFDLGACTSEDTFNCGNPLRENIDHSAELVVLYLADDAPPDALPIPILVHPFVDTTHSAAEVAVFAGLESWVAEEMPAVTIVGYGIGSEDYNLNGTEIRGRDYGVLDWIATTSAYSGFLGAETCDSAFPSADEPAVVVSPDDLTLTGVGGDPLTVEPGQNFDAAQSHSGQGDSGGPVLVGAGAASNDESPTRPPAPGPADSYDPDRQYVAGTASIYVGSGELLATAYTPTWTLSASSFLMTALRDGDGDGYADPVDRDRDGDGCDDNVDQHPDDALVEIGQVLNFNCVPSRSSRFGDESVDTDGDGLTDCEDRNDDNDSLLDFQDPCPLTADAFCFQIGATCPWNRQFFDCRLGGCNEIQIKFSSLGNPDPTAGVFFPLLSSNENTVTIGAALGTSLDQSARILGGFAGTTAVSPDYFLLEVIGPDGRTRGAIGGYAAGDVRIVGIDGADALALYLNVPGVGLVVQGARFPSTLAPLTVPALDAFSLGLATAVLLLAAALGIARRRPA